MVTATAIGAHNRNCHSKKRALALEKKEMEEEEERKQRRQEKENEKASNVDPVEDNVGDQSTPIQELKWMEVRMSPFRENKEDSLLFRTEGDETKKTILLESFFRQIRRLIRRQIRCKK
jgi:hypothetical protein